MQLMVDFRYDEKRSIRMFKSANPIVEMHNPSESSIMTIDSDEAVTEHSSNTNEACTKFAVINGRFEVA